MTKKVRFCLKSNLLSAQSRPVWVDSGKKWTMLILRDIGFLKIVRFNRILESIPGHRRVLSMRLRELEDKGFIEYVGGKRHPIWWCGGLPKKVEIQCLS